MAFLQNNEEQQNPNLPTYPAQGQGQSPLVGQSSNTVGNNVSTAGIGKGGKGGWTNIQAYLGANQNDTGSAQNLQQTVGEQFNKESQNIQQGAQGFLSNAQKQVDDDKIDNNKANEIIQQSANSYSWDDGNQSQTYLDNRSKMRNALTGEYSGPREYTYALGAETQKYADSLKDRGGFDNLMTDIYKKRANAPLSAGQIQLQKQFDVNNTALEQSKQKLLSDYSGLEQKRDQTVQDTTSALSGLESQYRQNQNALRDYLMGQQNEYDQKIGQAEADARAAYARTLQDKTGEKAAFYDRIMGNIGDLSGQESRTRRQESGIWGNNLTWDQLAKESEILRPGKYGMTYQPGELIPIWWDDAKPELSRRQGIVNQFYSDQDAKYANTADPEERSFNAILDFLNSDQARKEQGFKVRGK